MIWEIIQWYLSPPKVNVPYSVKISEIFSIHYFIAEGKKVKGMVKNDVFGDGVGRFMDFLSVRP